VLALPDSEAAKSFASLAASSWVHFALRKGWGKTVMPHEHSSGAAGLAADRVSQAAASRQALDQLFSVTYEELRRLASTVKRGDPGITLSPTALVNEAWLKLMKSRAIAVESPLHFKRIAARAMRQLLIEAARRRHAHKRGGADAIFVTFDDAVNGVAACGNDLLVLDSALAELASFEPRQAAIVESRFFGGLEISEISSLLGVSEATILRDWRAAKAWLGQRLRQPH
jgi:RNA polymerase sigma factor (TIGR02999 family)